MKNGFYINYTASWYKTATWLKWFTVLLSSCVNKGTCMLQRSNIVKKNVILFFCKNLVESVNSVIPKFIVFLFTRGCGRDRMVVGFATTMYLYNQCYHYYNCELDSRS